MKYLFLIVTTAFLATGCATVGTENTAPTAQKADEEYLTGSRLPRKNADNTRGTRSTTMDPIAREQMGLGTGRIEGMGPRGN